MKPDIAIFLMDLRGGGAERVMLNLATGFASQGMSVDLVLVEPSGEYVDQVPQNLNIVKLNAPRLIASIPKLISYLKKQQPKALISALEDTNLIAIVSRQLAQTPTKLVVTVHNHLSHEIKYSKQLKRKLVPYLIRWFYGYADAVIGVSRGVVDDLIKFGSPKAKTHVIYNPIVTTDLLNKLEEPLNHPWFGSADNPVILGVGRLSRQKDFETLIRAFDKVAHQTPSRLVILGDGEERENLQRLIAELGLIERVALLNFVANPYIYMRDAAVLVLSSAWEGFGNVLVEAMAAGTPVVSTNCDSGPAEILEQGRYGRLVAVGDVSALAQAILDVLKHTPQNSELLVRRASDFSLEVALRKYQDILEM